MTHSSHVGSVAVDRFLRDGLWPLEGADMAKMYGLGIKSARGALSPLFLITPEDAHIQTLFFTQCLSNLKHMEYFKIEATLLQKKGFPRCS